ncbi:methylated-DNA--[protein]-cysteine S-methyltransferase [Paenibacillus sp. FJAT-26967]|uniref:methylated-DNA--[protein]-cysteine S-methyltransferase n=1 Tax=Paenibacillus sp. FJAT-26967 TaxID=1729690 RepID=UPI000838120E|nr:methylated-DNA--[protein]-cysteine S-methyltransferase [Paenibacillus sp. FJAT-26967]
MNDGHDSEFIDYDVLEESPAGPLLLAATDQGLCTVAFGGLPDALEKLRRWKMNWMPEAGLRRNPGRLRTFAGQLDEYFAGRRKEFDLPIDLRGTEFQRRVWTALLKVPYGETASYKDIAESIGAPKAVRAVGGANNRNPVPILVPCHRIIGASGQLVGYAGGLNIKTTLLQLEISAETS